jgi:hypothetical protein
MIDQAYGPIAQGLERSADNGEVSRSSRLRPTSSTFEIFVVCIRIVAFRGKGV